MSRGKTERCAQDGTQQQQRAAPLQLLTAGLSCSLRAAAGLRCSPSTPLIWGQTLPKQHPGAASCAVCSFPGCVYEQVCLPSPAAGAAHWVPGGSCPHQALCRDGWIAAQQLAGWCCSPNPGWPSVQSRGVPAPSCMSLWLTVVHGCGSALLQEWVLWDRHLPHPKGFNGRNTAYIQEHGKQGELFWRLVVPSPAQHPLTRVRRGQAATWRSRC